MKRSTLLHAAPLLVLLAWISLPLARGAETLFLRDVLNAHLEMKMAQAEAMRQGTFPLIDPYRAGGQPLAGNPNAVPFYPDNLLYLLAPPLWSLNAHFWLHLLLAPFAFAWLARAWGLSREASWAAAALYTLSGFFLSHLNFYNLIAGATLAPAFVAAALRLSASGKPVPGAAPALALLWALLLLGGDPLMAALALLLALGAVLLRPSPRRPLSLLPALALGTLVAAPQIVEFVRILPLSFRGYWGYAGEVATIASWDPRQALEWLLPFAFGRPDLQEMGSFWGSRFFTGVPPYFLSLYPGLLALALAAASGRPRTRAHWWAWGAVAFGLFFALGRFNPLTPVIAWLFGLAGGGALRYPVKFWLPVAMGAALLGGLGFERLLSEDTGDGRRAFARALAALALLLGFLFAVLTFAPAAAQGFLRRLIPADFSDPFVTNERLRWTGLCLFSLLVLAALAAAARLARRRPAAGGALLVACHALAQLLLLRPLYPTDAAVPYRLPPPALEHVPAGALVTHGSFNHLFGRSNLDLGTFPAPRTLWLERRAFYELYPMTGPLWGRRYELNVSPEGLDSFLTRVAQGAVKGADDGERVRLLAAWGIGRLLLDRPLAPGVSETGGARLLARIPSFGQALHVYEIAGAAPEAALARRVGRAPHLTAAIQLMVSPGFDPAADVVLPGEGRPEVRGGGRVRVLRRGAERLELEVEAAGPGLLVLQRAHLPLYRATVDGRAVPLLPANLHRIGIEVPPGRHRVLLETDRRPLRAAAGVAVLGLVGLIGLALTPWPPLPPALTPPGRGGRDGSEGEV